MRLDRNRQDGRLPAAHSATAAREAAGRLPRADPLSDAGAGAADRRAGARARLPRGPQCRRGRGRRRHGPAGARAARRQRPDRGHARTAARPHAVPIRRPRCHRGAGPRRGRPHARHGLLARRSPHHFRLACNAPDPAVLRHAVGEDSRARRGDPARSGDRHGGPSGAGERDRTEHVQRGAGQQGRRCSPPCCGAARCARSWSS